MAFDRLDVNPNFVVIYLSVYVLIFLIQPCSASPFYGPDGKAPHSTSAFAEQTAHTMVEAVVMKSKWFNFLTDDPGRRLWFYEDQFNSFTAVQHFQGMFLLILTFAGSEGGKKVSTFAEITAGNMFKSKNARATVLYFLATTLYPGYADSLARNMVLKVKFTSAFLEFLFTHQ
jgi:hypothetical protein